MQSALPQPDLTAKPGNVITLRIVTYGLRTRETLDALVGTQDTATATATLAQAGVTPAAKSPYLDVTGLLTTPCVAACCCSSASARPRRPGSSRTTS
jgi:hypothetical protein